MSSPTTTSVITSIVTGVKRLLGLYVENVRLKTTEKITILLAAIAFYGVIMALGLVCLVFISIGVGHLLATTLAPHMAYLIIAGFYLILFIITFTLRTKIFVDPISRFMSRLLVEMPEDERQARQCARADTPRGGNPGSPVPPAAKPRPTRPTPPTPATAPEPTSTDQSEPSDQSDMTDKTDKSDLSDEPATADSADLTDPSEDNLDIIEEEEIIIKYPDGHDAH